MDGTPESGQEAAGDGNGSPLWLAVVAGVVAFLVLVAVAIGGVLLLAWAGVISDRRVLAVLGVGAAAFAAAIAVWLVTTRLNAPRRPLVGELVSLVAVVLLLLASWPFVRPMMDVKSVAIALGWSDAPNVGTQPSQVLHRVNEASAQSGGSDALTSTTDTIVVAVAFVVMVVAMLVISGALGGMLASRRDGRERRRAQLLLPALVVAGMVLAFPAWPSVWVMTNALVDFDQSAGPESGVNISEVVNHPDAMWGERVVVSATVKEVLDSHSATIGNDALLVGDTLLIVGPRELTDHLLTQSGGELGEGDVVQVSGTVRRYQPEQLATELDIGLEAARASDYGGRAVIVVDSIDPDVPAAGPAGDPELLHETTAGYDYGVTLDDVMVSPDEHVGMTVTVSGEVEETVLTPHAFVLDDQGLLAISEEAHPELFVEATAYVTGEVRMFDLAEVEQETGLDLDEEALAQFEGRPFILVESVSLVR